MMTGNRVTDPAKLDLITTTQAGDNERYQVEVSRSFICTCADTYAFEPQPLMPQPQRSGYRDRYAPFETCETDLSGDPTLSSL